MFYCSPRKVYSERRVEEGLPKVSPTTVVHVHTSYIEKTHIGFVGNSLSRHVVYASGEREIVGKSFDPYKLHLVFHLVDDT